MADSAGHDLEKLELKMTMGFSGKISFLRAKRPYRTYREQLGLIGPASYKQFKSTCVLMNF